MFLARVLHGQNRLVPTDAAILLDIVARIAPKRGLNRSWLRGGFRLVSSRMLTASAGHREPEVAG